MTFFQVPFKISEKSGSQQVSIDSVTQKLDLVLDAFKNNDPNFLETAENFRNDFLNYVKQGGNRTEMTKAFLKLAFVVSSSHSEFGLNLLNDCLNWYPGQHWVMSRYNMYIEKLDQANIVCENFWRLLQKYPENPHAYTQLGNFLLKHSYYYLALVVMRAAVRNFPEDTITLNCLADIYLKSGHFEQAIICYKNSVKRFPDNPVNITGLADAYLKNGMGEESINVYKQAIKIYPSDPVIRSGLADAYLKSGKIKESIEAYKSMVEDLPNSVICKAGLADAYSKNAQIEDSITIYKQALDIAPDNHICLNGLANVYMRAQEHQKAIEIFELAIQNNPQSAVAFNGLAEANLESGNTDKAIDLYHQAIIKFSENNLLYEGLIKAYFVKKSYVEANSIIEDALIKFSRNSRLLVAFAEINLLLRKFDDALSIIRNGINQYPENSKLFFDLVVCYIYLGQTDEAKEELDKALAKFDDAELKYLSGRFKELGNFNSRVKDEEAFFQTLDGILVNEVMAMREREKFKESRIRSSKKYSYYVATLNDEFRRMKNNGFSISTPLVITRLLLKNDQELDLGEEQLQNLETLSLSFSEEYNYKLLELVLSMDDDVSKIIDQEDDLSELLKNYGNKWELLLIKNVLKAAKDKKIDEVNYKNISRTYFQNSDYNEYIQGYAKSVSGDKDAFKSFLNTFKRKMQGPSTRQKILWFFGHSKASVKQKGDKTFCDDNFDLFKIRQMLFSEFYPEIYRYQKD